MNESEKPVDPKKRMYNYYFNKDGSPINMGNNAKKRALQEKRSKLTRQQIVDARRHLANERLKKENEAKVTAMRLAAAKQHASSEDIPTSSFPI